MHYDNQLLQNFKTFRKIENIDFIEEFMTTNS